MKESAGYHSTFYSSCAVNMCASATTVMQGNLLFADDCLKAAFFLSSVCGDLNERD